MTTVSKHFLIVLGPSASVLAQSAPRKSHANTTTSATTSAKGKGQKDEAAKNSGSHTTNTMGNHKDIMGTAANPNQGSPSHNNMVGNHKDVMSTAADNNQTSGSHTANTMGNHKDVMMGTAPNPSTGNKTQPALAPAAAPAPNPTPASDKPAAPAPQSPRWKR